MSAPAVRSRLCPDDFCPATLPAEPPSSFALDALRKPDTELWLIRAPADFSPASLNGCKVPLVGFQSLKSHRNETGVRQRYHVLSNTSTGPETLLAPSSSAVGQLVPAPALQGTLKIIEVPRTKSSGRSLHAIPTSPPPQIPPGLWPRFRAFGGQQPMSEPPTQTATVEARKGKASRKRKKSESASLNPSPQEVLNVVNSAPGQEIPRPVEQMPIKTEEGAALLSAKKKKKKKKELEGEVPEPGGEVLEGRVMELQEEVALSSTKTKKSKKRRELEEQQLESEVHIDLQEEKAPSSTKKKSRKNQEAEGERQAPEQAIGLEEEMVGLPPTKRKKEEPEGEMPVEAEMTEILGEVEPLHSKKKKRKKRKPEEGEGVAPEPPKEMESLAEVPESVAPSPSQGVEEKKKKKKKKQQKQLPEGQVGTVEA